MTENFRILVIEDDKAVATTVKDKLMESIEGIKIEVEHNFGKAVKHIEKFEPDAAVLDLIEGSISSGNMTGNLSWQEIWDHRFIPLIVYTASSQQTEPPLPTSHPFVTRIAKGTANSLEEVVKALSGYIPYMSLAREFVKSVSSQVQIALRDSAPRLLTDVREPAKRAEMFSRVLKRRVAASVDLPYADADKKLVHWEQFIYPPISSHLLTGDILREIGAAQDACGSYRIVLTPSCDLVLRANGKPKSRLILVAKGVDLRVVWERWSLSKPDDTVKEKSAKEKLRILLTDPQLKSGLLLMPEFPGLIPHMGIDFRELQLINYSDIKGFGEDDRSEERQVFERIASIDSPFREAISWAYVQIACRPGLPDRQVDKWIDELIKLRKRLPDTTGRAK